MHFRQYHWYHSPLLYGSEFVQEEERRKNEYEWFYLIGLFQAENNQNMKKKNGDFSAKSLFV